jgi:hypothetical protein
MHVDVRGVNADCNLYIVATCALMYACMLHANPQLKNEYWLYISLACTGLHSAMNKLSTKNTITMQ